MTNGHCPETYEIEEPRKGSGKNRNRKATPNRKARHTVATETTPVREREPRRS